MTRNEYRSDIEYSALRDEILSLSQNECAYNIAMYTLGIGIISFSLERQSALLTLVVYLIIYVFQLHIKKCREGQCRLSAYISVFLQENNKGFYWESGRMDVNKYIWRKSVFGIRKSVYDRISWGGFLIFGYLSIIICLYHYFLNRCLENIVVLFISVVLLSIVFRLNKEVLAKNAYDNMYLNYIKWMKEFKESDGID